MKRAMSMLVLAAIVALPLAPIAFQPPAEAISHAVPKAAKTKVVKSKKVGKSVVTLSTRTGKISAGDNEVTVSVTDKAGKPRTATVQKLSIYMPPMGMMAAMKADAKLEPARTPGVYTGTLDVEMKGPWKVTVTFEDEKGPHKASFNIVAK